MELSRSILKNVYYLKLWDVSSGSVLLEYATKTDLYSVAAHPDGCHAVIGGYDGIIRLIDLNVGVVVRV